MAVSMLELFRTLTSFSPKRVDLRGAPWEPFVDWAIGQGLAPLAAYNLEYRLGGGSSVPEWVRHRLLSLYQGSANDNVMKLVNLKQSLAELEGRKLVMLGGVSFSESVYPHIAFRPVIDARLYVPSADLEPLATWLRRAEFKPIEAVDRAGAQKVLSDTRTQLFLHGRLFDDAKQDVALLSRVLPMRPFGSSAYRLELEDALLVHVMLMSRQGFEVPMLEFIDLRELVLGAPSMGGAYSREPDVAKILSRAAEWKVERGLYAALGVVERLWPETSEIVTKLRPSLSLPVRELLDRAVVAPLSEIGRTEDFKGAETLRSLLAGD